MEVESELTGKVAVVTGASQGIGASIVWVLLDAGMAVEAILFIALRPRSWRVTTVVVDPA